MSSEKSEVTLKLNLLDNGVDFILKGIDELFDEDHILREYSTATDISLTGFKYGVIHLFSGFLLLLKERLSRHLPELIFKGRLNDVRNKLSSGKTPNTIDLDEALERLESSPKVTFSENELDIIKSIQRIRNQFEHYQVEINKYHLWKNISKFLELVDNFLVRELQINIETSAESSELIQKIHTIDSVWKRIDSSRRRDWRTDAESKLKEFNRNRDKIIKDLNTEYYINKGAEEVFTTCSECDDYTLIAYGKYEGICSNPDCNTVNPLKTCDRCGASMQGFSWDFSFCDYCTDWISEQ